MTTKVLSSVLLIVLTTTIIFSCKKKVSPYTISGHIYLGCPKQPAANQTVKLRYLGQQSLQAMNITDQTIVTDANGFFTFQSTLINGWWLEVDAFGQQHLYSSSATTNVTNIEIYQSLTKGLKIYLNVTKPYTASDTLAFQFLWDTLGHALTFQGPFHSGFLYTATGMSNSVKQNYYSNQDNVNTGSPFINYAVNPNRNGLTTTTINYLSCDTSTVTVNIN